MVTKIGCSYDGKGSVRDSIKFLPERFSRTYGGGMFAEIRESLGGDALARKLVKELRAKSVIGKTNLTDPDKGIYQSETGEIVTDVNKKTLRVVTKRLEGAVFKNDEPVRLDAMTVSRCSVPASLTAIVLDSAPSLRKSKRILLVAATQGLAENSVFDSGNFGVEIDFGKFPVLYRSGTFALSLATDSATAPSVYALNLDGTRERKLESAFADGRLSLTLDTSKLEYGTPFFEIVYP